MKLEAQKRSPVKVERHETCTVGRSRNPPSLLTHWVRAFTASLFVMDVMKLSWRNRGLVPSFEVETAETVPPLAADPPGSGPAKPGNLDGKKKKKFP
jgi:hypothetical protein